MPRAPRIVEDGSYHHILTRGNDKKCIFRTRQDYLCLRKLIVEALDKYQILIYNYCLMNNHLHLLLKVIKEKDLSKFLQVIFQRYAHYFKKKYGHVGYLFQNRYKSHLIDKESYLLECARYIERNPVRAKLVLRPDDYEWSSFLYYAFGREDAIIKEPNPMYLQMAESAYERQELYRKYVNEERPYELLVDKGVGIE